MTDESQEGGGGLKGKELAAYLEQRRRERLGKQLNTRGTAAYGAGGPVAVPRRSRRSAEPYGDDLFGRRGPDGRRPTIVRVMIITGLIVIVLFLVSALRAHDAVKLSTSCSTPAFAVSVDTVTENGALQYAITGPPGRYVISARQAGSTGTDTVITSLRELKDCKARGAQAIKALTPGTYTLSLVRVDSPLTGPVATRQLTVTPK